MPQKVTPLLSQLATWWVVSDENINSHEPINFLYHLQLIMKQVLTKIVKLFGGLYRSVSGPSNLGTSHFQSWQFLKPNLNPPQKKKRERLKEIEEPEPIAERLWSKEHFISFVVCVSSKKKMKVGGGVVYGGPRGTVLPTLLLGHGRARLRCYSSSPTPGMYYVQFGFEMWIHSLLFGKNKKKKKCLIQNLIFVGIWVFHSDHITFIKDVAATQPPQHLCHLLRMLKTKGGSFFVPCFFSSSCS